MNTYDQIIEEGVIKGRQQGIDIAALARQYTDLPAERVQRIVDEINGAT